MKCDCCEKPAEIHLTDIINGQKRETHLCKSCAEEQQLLQEKELNFSSILQSVIAPHIGSVTDELSRLCCPICGMKYMEFRAAGRLGCPNDYQVFRSALLPLLKRIHRSTTHEGKVPRYSIQHAALQAELLELRKQLRIAVENEAYEEAARIRDILREKETLYGPG